MQILASFWTFVAGGILQFIFGPREPCPIISLLCNTSAGASSALVNDPEALTWCGPCCRARDCNRLPLNALPEFPERQRARGKCVTSAAQSILMIVAVSNGNQLMAFRRLSVALALLCGLTADIGASFAEDRAIVLASTTATQDSGLLDHLLPIFRDKTGIDVRVIAQRADEVLNEARKGDADVVLMHARPQEEKFVAEGFAVKRFDVMYNDYVLIGPKSDPAGVKGKDIATALKAIEAKGAPFVTRGDRSGTHAAELALWIVAGIDIAAAKGAWYREAKEGMGAALEAARVANAYVLSDRGSWIAFKERGDLDIIVEGDKRLLNQYGVMLVNPEKFPSVKKELGQTFIDWLISPDGQAAIAGYRVDGQQLFFPNADKSAG
ncbi:blr2306 [Bradyrhizobium diazoefficiens USDA 110]|uniref:Blr2306 protein n=2 Tax=Bradyrhizobium diazoefficiens TaxID=1355477 RepID=Q89SU4_BRADU|nr:tungsten ABC transporter permease [Bradyrhizobium diazoefficiens]QBP21134.1 tungsten ABC transporter permease [Bradyrhizobium diazoefficiens]BAC47571.1 blr2306 [Bradyrhizobium diazoefficiens USDA 110]